MLHIRGIGAFLECDPIAEPGHWSALSKCPDGTDRKVKVEDEVTCERAGPLDDWDVDEFAGGDGPVTTKQVGGVLGLELMDDAVTRSSREGQHGKWVIDTRNLDIALTVRRY